jgi:hypothetical protein
MQISKHGSRTIDLFTPFDWWDDQQKPVKVRRVTIAPISLDQSIRWSEGGFKNAVELLSEMIGWPVEQTRQLRYPDVDRVFEQFLIMVPESVRADVAEGIVPKVEIATEEIDETPAETAAEPSGAAEAVPPGPDRPELFPPPSAFPPTETDLEPPSFEEPPDFASEEAA